MTADLVTLDRVVLGDEAELVWGSTWKRGLPQQPLE
tara:strand:- start:377 stop:484 length:108 start_codon:yes stop_codon:yes gene_type:complete